MSLEEFNSIFKKIEDTFGTQNYPSTRKKLFWDEFSFEDSEDFACAVDTLIKNNKFAPMGEDFRTEIAFAKEKKYYQKKKFFSSTSDLPASEMSIQDDDRKMLFGEIMRRANGIMPDHEWEGFKTILHQMTNQLNKTVCRLCKGKGVVTSKANYAFKCVCVIGKNDNRKYPVVPDFIVNQFKNK